MAGTGAMITLLIGDLVGVGLPVAVPVYVLAEVGIGEPIVLEVGMEN